MLITTSVLQNKLQGYTLSYFYRALVLYFYPELLLNFVSMIYISECLGNIFKFVVFRLLENVFCESKNWKYTFLFMCPQAKLSIGSYYHLQNSLSPPLLPSFPLPMQRFFKNLFKTLSSFARYIFNCEDFHVVLCWILFDVFYKRMVNITFWYHHTCGLDFNW